MLRETRWSGGLALPTFMPVAGSDADRAAFKKRLGYTLARCRELAHLTQEAAAPKLGVNVQTLSRWETGTHECKPYDLAQMWALYDAPAEWLMNPSDSITEWEVRIAQRVARGLRRGLDPDQELRDAAGTIIGTSALAIDPAGPEPAGSGAYQCGFAFTVDDLPESTFYEVTVGDRGDQTYSLAELEAQDWRVELTLGG